MYRHCSFFPNNEKKFSTNFKQPPVDIINCKAISFKLDPVDLSTELFDKDPVKERIKNFIKNNHSQRQHHVSSFYYHPSHNPTVAALAPHSDKLNAKHCLLLSYRKLTLHTMYRLCLLIDQEIIVGAA